MHGAKGNKDLLPTKPTLTWLTKLDSDVQHIHTYDSNCTSRKTKNECKIYRAKRNIKIDWSTITTETYLSVLRDEEPHFSNFKRKLVQLEITRKLRESCMEEEIRRYELKNDESILLNEKRYSVTIEWDLSNNPQTTDLSPIRLCRAPTFAIQIYRYWFAVNKHDVRIGLSESKPLFVEKK